MIKKLIIFCNEKLYIIIKKRNKVNFSDKFKQLKM